MATHVYYDQLRLGRRPKSTQEGTQGGGTQGGTQSQKESNIRWEVALDEAIAHHIATNYSQWLTGNKIGLSKTWAKEIGIGSTDFTPKILWIEVGTNY